MKSEFEEFPRIYKNNNTASAIIESGKEMFFKKNTFIVSPSDIVEGFYFVKKGRVIGLEYSPRGNEKILGIIESNGIFLESNIFLNIPALCYFKTIEDSTLIFVGKEALFDLLKRDINTTVFILQSIATKFHANMNHVDELLYHNTEWKICKAFLTFADKFGEKHGKGTRINLKLSQQFISNLLGINRVTTARVIKYFKSLGLIEQIDGYYCIADIGRLKDYQNSL